MLGARRPRRLGEDRHAAVAGVRRGARRLGPVGGHHRRLRRRAPRPPGSSSGTPWRGPGELGVQSVVVTFDPHPAEVVRPGLAPGGAHRAGPQGRAVAALGVDVLCVLPFTLGVLPAARRGVRPRRAGRAAARGGRRGGGELPVRAQGGRRRARCWTGSGARSASPPRASPLVADDGHGLLLDLHPGLRRRRRRGAAAAALGRPHRVEGVVVRGDQRGRELGFPTANLLAPPVRRDAGRRRLRRLAGPRAAAGRGRAGGACRSAPTRPSPAGSAGSRRTCWTSTATSTASSSALDFVARLREQRRVRRRRAAGRPDRATTSSETRAVR